MIWFVFMSISYKAFSGHISGGEMLYTFVKVSNGEYTYDVTLKLYRICEGGREINNSTIISVFNRETYAGIKDVNVSLAFKRILSLSQFDPCILNPPAVCYEVGYFNTTITLPGNIEGYILSSQVIYRVQGINNLQPGYGNIGATYTAEIPGTQHAINGPTNSSATFTGNDLVLVCANHPLSYSFAAQDADGDKLQYRFCEAFKTGTIADAENINPPTAPPYLTVPYGNGYNSISPLGQRITINSSTGLITGIAPVEGIYIVTVCVDEIRNGKLIATQRKDLQIKITGCESASAVLPPEYLLCSTTSTLSLSNLVQNNLIRTQYWEITDKENNLAFSSTLRSPEYTFPDTGIYFVKLVINQGQSCSDSTVALARVYPGTKAGFSNRGVCIEQPSFFTDASITKYGSIQSWNWNFGDPSSTPDTSGQQHPSYQYNSPGTRLVTLKVTTSKGCVDTASRILTITDKPPLQLAFKDTLICKGDTLRMRADAPGIYEWTPAAFLSDQSSSSPSVFPASTTTYYAFLTDEGCRNMDSVVVRVTDSVQLRVMKDTIICQNDFVQFSINSDALTYSWTPAHLFGDPSVKSPFIKVPASTSFTVNAMTGGCSQSKNIHVTTLPYPEINAGKDTTICYHSFVQLKGFSSVQKFNWMPSQILMDANSLSPSATLVQTTTFILTATDPQGCPKPITDTVIVYVLPKVNAFAGNDTSVVINQPLQLEAKGGGSYTWYPPTYLTKPDISNPVALIPFPTNKISYTVTVKNEAGCTDTSTMTIAVFEGPPSVFIPTAFTPNADGKNDQLRLISAGIQQVDFFQVFNRWGQLVFATTTLDKGWNGNFQGQPQATGSYVWMVKGKDYTGKPFFKKGLVTLIR